MIGGLLASAIANMDGIRGYSSWRWVFILEGLTTILIGVISYLFMSDFPEDTRWLNEEEKRFIVARAGVDKEHAQPINGRHVLHFFTDFKNVLGAVIYFGGTPATPLELDRQR